MGSNALTDKSGQLEAQFSGFLVDAARPFAEPGIAPHYAPDVGFKLSGITLHLTIDPAAKTLQGEAEISIDPLISGLGEVSLDFDDMTVETVEDATTGAALQWRHTDAKLRIMGMNSQGGKVRVRWHGSPTRGLYFTGPTPANPDRPFMAWSQCQDEDAHFFFPCIDQPGVKAPMEIRVTVPEGYTAIGNGEAKGQDGCDFLFSQIDPIPAYLFTVVVGPLTVLQDGQGDIPIQYWAPEGTDEATLRRVFDKTPRMIKLFEQTFGHPYPWPRYDQVVVHDFIFGGMENVAATTLTDMVLTDERAAIDWDAESLIAHELAHQWFGDLITCQDWSQGWLNEGWATYSEIVWKVHDLGQAEADYHLFSDLANYLSESGGRYQRAIVSYQFREPIDMFDRHLYEKGALVNHTLRTVLGETAFWDGVAHYLRRHAHGTVHTRDYQRALEEVSGRNLDGFFQQWVHAPGHPKLSVTTSWTNGLLEVKVEQQQSGKDVPEIYQLPLDIKVITETDEQHVTLRVAERVRAWVIPCTTEPKQVEVDAGFRILSEITVSGPRPWLVASLKHDSSVVGRIRAARALAKEGSPKAVEALITALADEDFWGVRLQLADILADIGTATVRTALLDCIDDAHPKARRGIVAAIAKLPRHPDITAALTKIAQEGDPSIQVEGEAVRSLGKLRTDNAVAMCTEVSGRPSWNEMLACRALEGISYTRSEAALPLLLDWTSEESHERARATAAAGLGRLADEVEPCRNAAIERLIELAIDAPFRVRYAAIPALGQARAIQAYSTLQRIHEGQSDGRLRRQAYEAIQRITASRGGESTMANLRRGLEKLRDENRALRTRVDALEKTNLNE